MEQMLLQAPQLVGLLVRSTHPALQGVNGLVQQVIDRIGAADPMSNPLGVTAQVCPVGCGLIVAV